MIQLNESTQTMVHTYTLSKESYPRELRDLHWYWTVSPACRLSSHKDDKPLFDIFGFYDHYAEMAFLQATHPSKGQ